MMSKISKTAVKNHLQSQSHEELVAEILHLYAKFEPVQAYFAAQLGVENNPEFLERYKKVIRQEFFPKRGMGEARLSIARKAVSDFAKVVSHPEELIDLMLFYVENGIAFTNKYGDIDESFYTSMEKMFERALKLIVKEGKTAEFQPRCLKMVRQTSGIGWGFQDTLKGIFAELLGNEG